MPPLEAPHASGQRTTIAVGAEEHQTRNLERLVDAMYSPAATFDAWCEGVARTAARVLEGSIDAKVVRVEGSARPRIDDSSKTLCISGELAENETIVLSIRHEREQRLLRYERALLLRIALHLENAASLKAATRVRGTIGWNDRALVVNDRSPQGLWLDLVQGRASLARIHENAGRYFILDAPSTWARHRALTETETSAVMLCAAGMQYKSVADELRISTPSVSRALAGAAAKIGVRAPFELLRIAARLGGHDEGRQLLDTRLTESEQEVLALVVAGYSNRAIAELRGRSTRTVANQVASVLRKTGCASRRALATMRRL